MPVVGPQEVVDRPRSPAVLVDVVYQRPLVDVGSVDAPAADALDEEQEREKGGEDRGGFFASAQAPFPGGRIRERAQAVTGSARPLETMGLDPLLALRLRTHRTLSARQPAEISQITGSRLRRKRMFSPVLARFIVTAPYA